MQPTYDFNNFVDNCAIGTESVQIRKQVIETAKNDFNLRTVMSILAFIASGGLEQPHFINSKVWEKNPFKSEGHIFTDAYGFYSGKKYGYISFLYQNKTSKWLIKSFKKNTNPDTRNLPFKGLNLLLGEAEVSYE